MMDIYWKIANETRMTFLPVTGSWNFCMLIEVWILDQFTASMRDGG